MTKHFDARLLAGTALSRAPETKDDDPSVLSAQVKSALDDLTKTFVDFRTKNDDRLKEIEKKGAADVVTRDEVDRINKAVDEAIAKAKAEVKSRVDELEAKANRLSLGQGGPDGKKHVTPEMAEYAKKFEEHFRQGTVSDFEMKSLESKAVAGSTDSKPGGGFTVRPEMETAIDSVVKEISPFRQLATVRPIGTSTYTMLVNQKGATSGWVAEKEARIQTLVPDLSEVEFPTMEIYAMPAATQTLLDDSYVDIDQWLADEVSEEFAAQEGKAFITGDGIKKPKGILGAYDVVADNAWSFGKLGYIATGAAGAFAASNPADKILDLIYTPKATYRQNAQFLMARRTMAEIRKMKDGQGNYIAGPSMSDGALVEKIFGFPVQDAEDMPAIGANSLSIAFGDFRRGYLIVDRYGVRVLRDPYSAKPYVLFYTTKRVGGGVKNFEAIKLLKFAAS